MPLMVDGRCTVHGDDIINNIVSIHTHSKIMKLTSNLASEMNAKHLPIIFAITAFTIVSLTCSHIHINRMIDMILDSEERKGTHLTQMDVFDDGHTKKMPEVLSTDIIYNSRDVFVIPEYKLIFFTFPKVASSEWKRMFMRMNGNRNWCKTRGFNAHDPKLNKIKLLKDYKPEIATVIMTSSQWKRATIVREPKERILSAFMDKAFNEDYYVKKCCKNLPNEKLMRQCKENKKDFESFIKFVTEYPRECSDAHWDPQILMIDAKWWPYIDWIGHQDNLLHDSKEILRQLTSNKDKHVGRSAWERYGVSGWGSGPGCEDRPNCFLEENTSAHKFDTGKRLIYRYTAKTEKMVEEKWAAEWEQGYVNFPKVQLFNSRLKSN